MSLIELRFQNNEMDGLLNENVALEKDVMNLESSMNRIVSSTQNYIIFPNNDSSLQLYDDAKSSYLTIRTEFLDLANEINKKSGFDISTEIGNLEDLINNVITTIEEKDGIFDEVENNLMILENNNKILDQFSIQIDQIYDMIVQADNDTKTIADLLNVESTLFEGETFAYLFSATGDLTFKVTSEYLLGINNDSSIVTDSVISNEPQIQLYYNDLQTRTNQNQTIQQSVSVLGSSIGKIKHNTSLIIESKQNLSRGVSTLINLIDHIEDENDNLIGQIDTYLVDAQQNIDARFARTLNLLLIMVGVVILIALFLVRLITNMTVGPLQQLQENTKRLAKGDLRDNTTSTHYYQDEIGILEQDFDEMRNQLEQLVKSITIASNTLTASSEELASASEETNAATEEVSSTSQSMSQAASQQAEMIARSVEEISRIGSIVNEIIEQIQQNSDVISQIALQTNILALNAGIEASRAGDYGRGFAVVAENVRRLSEESKIAAEQITEVAGSVSETLSDAFNEIRIQIEEVAALSEETAASAEEVAAAAEEVTSSMEEVSASSQDLSEVAIESLDRVSTFQTD